MGIAVRHRGAEAHDIEELLSVHAPRLLVGRALRHRRGTETVLGTKLHLNRHDLATGRLLGTAAVRPTSAWSLERSEAAL
jgi:hypothetical protein